jgi:hypothetical protein
MRNAFRDDPLMVSIIVGIVLVMVGLVVWLIVAGIKGDLSCDPGTHEVVTGYVPVTTVVNNIPSTTMVPTTECVANE